MSAAIHLIALAQIGAGTRAGPLPRVESPAEWSLIVEMAIEHRVAPLVWRALADAPPGWVPESIMRTLEEQAWWGRGARMLCEHTLQSLLALAAAERIDILVLKGASLAHTLYPQPDLRPYHDLDILCRPAEQPRFIHALLAGGYLEGKIEREPEIEGRSLPVQTYIPPSGALDIEVHVDALQLGLIERHHEDLWRDAREITCDQLHMRVLSPTHQLLHLVAHAHRHCYSRLLWLIDLDLLIRREYDQLDWARVLSIARDEGIATILRYVLAATHALLRTPLPVLPAPTPEERILGVCYRLVWPRASVRRLQHKERRRLLYFRPEKGDPRETVYGLLLLGRRREKWHILRKNWRRSLGLAPQHHG